MKNKMWNKGFTLIILITFLLYISYNIFINTLPLHIKEIGGNPTQIGLVVGLFALAALISRPFAGNLLDNYGRKILFITTLVIISLISILYAFPLAIILILILRFVHGAFWGSTSTAIASLLSDITQEKQRSEAWGYFVFASSMAMAVGSTAVSFLMTAYNFVPTSLIASAVMVACCILALSINYPKYEKKKANERQKISFSNLFEKKALFPSLLSILLMLTMGFVMAFISIFGKQINVENTGVFFAGFAIIILVSKFVGKKLIERLGHKSALIAGPICVIAKSL